MTNDNYKEAKTKSRVSLDSWCRMLSVSRDTDKSYSAGRLAISKASIERIEYLERLQASGADQLAKVLREAFPDAQVTQDLPARDVVLAMPLGKPLVFVESGIDLNGWPIHIAGPSHRPLATFLFAAVPPYLRERLTASMHNSFATVLWRGQFERVGDPSLIESYWNAPTADRLRKLFLQRN